MLSEWPEAMHEGVESATIADIFENLQTLSFTPAFRLKFATLNKCSG
jgi:hypothetical protein